MTHIQAVALYAGVLALMNLTLVVLVVRQRLRTRTSIGHGAEGGSLHLATRAHANFTENVPLCLVLMTVAAMIQAPILVIHAAGVALVVGRAVHAIGLSQTASVSSARRLGTLATWIVLVVLAVTLLWKGLA